MSQSSGEYTVIQSIHDIDPNKLPMTFVGKKYIDKANNRYTVQYNKELRKMEIVRITSRSSGNPSLPKFDHKPTGKTLEEIEASIQPGKSTKPTRSDEEWSLSDIDLGLSLTSSPIYEPSPEPSRANADDPSLNANTMDSTSQTTPTETPILDSKWKNKNERDMIESLMKSLEDTKVRINAILINIKSSRIFEITGDPSDNNNIIGNLTREFDVEVFQSLDKASNYLKELMAYPRATSYYTAKYERSKKDELARAHEDKDKLHLIIRWEMQEAYSQILKKLKTLVLNLLDILNLKNDTHIKQLQYTNQLMFTDAKNATVFCSQDIEKLIRTVEQWKVDTLGGKNGSQ